MRIADGLQMALRWTARRVIAWGIAALIVLKVIG